jgi:hypothetical protein
MTLISSSAVIRSYQLSTHERDSRFVMRPQDEKHLRLDDLEGLAAEQRQHSAGIVEA